MFSYSSLSSTTALSTIHCIWNCLPLSFPGRSLSIFFRRSYLVLIVDEDYQVQRAHCPQSFDFDARLKIGCGLLLSRNHLRKHEWICTFLILTSFDLNLFTCLSNATLLFNVVSFSDEQVRSPINMSDNTSVPPLWRSDSNNFGFKRYNRRLRGSVDSSFSYFVYFKLIVDMGLTRRDSNASLRKHVCVPRNYPCKPLLVLICSKNRDTLCIVSCDVFAFRGIISDPIKRKKFCTRDPFCP